MKTIPKHFKLVKEHPGSYEIHDERDGKRFHIAKKDLNLGMHAKLSKIEHFDEGGEAGSDTSNSDTGGDSSGDNTPPVTVNVNAGSTPAPSAVAPMAVPAAPSPAALTPTAPGQPTGLGAGAVPFATAPPPASGSLTHQFQSAVQGQQQAAADIGNAEAQQEAEKAKALNGVYGPQGQMQALLDAHKSKMGAIEAENAELTKQVMNTNIDPNRWYANKSVPGKVATAIGIVLGGIGAGLQHSNTNQALEVMKDQIKGDIEAQKANLGKKTTLLSLNMEKYRNLDAATAATMQQMTAMVNGQMQLQAAKTGSPLAIARAKLAGSQLAAQSALETPKLAEADLKMNAISELNGTPTPRGGAHAALNPESAATPGSTPSPSPEATENPLGRTGSVDMKKMNVYQLAGLMPKEDVTAANKEMGDFQESQATKALLLKDFQQMRDAIAKSESGSGVSLRRAQEVLSKAPLVGGMVEAASPFGGEAGRKYAAAKASATNKINTLLTKRIGGEAMKNIAIDLPNGQETSPDEVNEKLSHVMDLIDSNSKTPTLDRYKLIR